ncbi:hypothetical protein niasHT_009213 [Heterodera trifolii]|uniref:Uncharacterized protein n=1 Tax=Heterodera trifolii TaxID=157864 RepID=A0ABD2LZ62_9BILA
MLDVQPQIVLVPSIVPVIVTTVALFLATHGPHNWPALWQELANPPPDARHAIRSPSPYSAYVRLSQAELEMRRAQLMTFVQVYGIIPKHAENHQQQQQNQHHLQCKEMNNCAQFCPNLPVPNREEVPIRDKTTN